MTNEAPVPAEDIESRAEAALESLLNDRENAFLLEVPANIQAIENADSYVEALGIAERLIIRRIEATFKFHPLEKVEGVEVSDVKAETILKFIKSLKERQKFVGEGGDAFVVMAENDLLEYPPEICYKIAKQEETKRGRNLLTEEAIIHDQVYRIAQELENSKIAIPSPYYVTEVGSSKIFAMQKLPARSIDDILHGIGTLPSWFDIDAFCEELQNFITMLHEQGIYHRDMHIGNVMIRQSEDEPEDGKWGYVIDFGLSGHGVENMDPYRKESAGNTFTYSDDYAIIKIARVALEGLRKRNLEMVE